jgi:integrase
MASIRKKFGSRFWFACFYGPDGRRIQRSTKSSHRKTAQAVAEKFEKAAKLASEKRLGEAQARRVLGDIYEEINGAPLSSATARDYLTRWSEARKADTSPRTHAAYAQVVREFIDALGDRADLDFSQVTKADIALHRDRVRLRTSVSTANKHLKYLRVAIGAARKEGLIQTNPAADLDILKRPVGDRNERRAFTLDELKLSLAHASNEWRGMILFGLYTGQRLRDLARLTWSNIDTKRRELRFVTAKTGRRMQIPLASPLLEHIETLPAGDTPDAPLFPELHKLAFGGPNDSRLSQQFATILSGAGLIVMSRNREPTGRGRSLRRNTNELSFHSLRHTATSLLKNAGVSEIVARDLIGHDSEAVSRNYSHVDEDAKRRAIETLPDILRGGKR